MNIDRESPSMNIENIYFDNIATILIKQLERVETNEEKKLIAKAYLYSMKESEYLNIQNCLTSYYFNRHNIEEDIKKYEELQSRYAILRLEAEQELKILT